MSFDELLHSEKLHSPTRRLEAWDGNAILYTKLSPVIFF